YSFDVLGRLLHEDAVQLTGGAPTIAYSDDYEYDLDGNRTKFTRIDSSGTQVMQYEYNNDDRLLDEITNGVVTKTYHYDANGSLIETSAPGETVHYVYDARMRLSMVTTDTSDSGGKVTEVQVVYSYDANDRRVSQTTTTTAPGQAPVVQVQHFLYDTAN